MSLIIRRVIFHYFLYLSNIIILHEVHLLSNYTFPMCTRSLINLVLIDIVQLMYYL